VFSLCLCCRFLVSPFCPFPPTPLNDLTVPVLCSMLMSWPCWSPMPCSQVLEACLEVLDPEPSPGDSSHLLAGPRSASPGREPPTAAEKLQRLPGQDFQWVLEAVVLAATAFLGHCQAVGEAVSLILSLAQAPAQQLAAAERDMAECRAAVAEAATARWSKLLGSRARGGGAEGGGGGTGARQACRRGSVPVAQPAAAPAAVHHRSARTIDGRTPFYCLYVHSPCVCT
jgi:hypothetical protein